MDNIQLTINKTVKEEKIKYCDFCKKEIISENEKFCSEDCKKKNKKENLKDWMFDFFSDWWIWK